MNFLNILVTAVVVFFLLHFGKFILIPLFFSLFFYVILNSISNDLISISNKVNIKIIKQKIKIPLLIDAGIGQASDAVEAMELGCDGVLILSLIHI